MARWATLLCIPSLYGVVSKAVVFCWLCALIHFGYLCSGSWRTADFKAYNFNALGQPTAGVYLHPLLKVQSWRSGKVCPAQGPHHMLDWCRMERHQRLHTSMSASAGSSQGLRPRVALRIYANQISDLHVCKCRFARRCARFSQIWASGRCPPTTM